LPTQFTAEHRDSPEPTLAAQGSQSRVDVVFSVVDGRIVRPALPQEVQSAEAIIYPGGSGYGYTTTSWEERVAFFDDAGTLLTEMDGDSTLDDGSFDMPVVSTKSAEIVLTLDGRRLVKLPPSVPYVDTRLIGSRFLVAADPDHKVWQQFDLRTGRAGKTCEDERLTFYYIASDGDVAVVGGDGGVAHGIAPG
jgi:hypothetical protein